MSTLFIRSSWHKSSDVDSPSTEQIIALISNPLAETYRRDSGSIKTIVITTMILLPGTFLAALFAMPSLDWDGPKVVTSKV